MPSPQSSPRSRPECKPRLRTRAPYSADWAEAVRLTARLAGIEQLDWQIDLIRDWSAHDERGQFIHRRVGASIPRQAGKSVDGIAWTAFLVAVLGYRVLWTDHNYSTTCEMLRRFKEIFGERPNDPNAKHKELNALVLKVNMKTAQETYFFKNGAILAFSTRTKSAGLGFSFDVVIYDEAQELTGEQMQALMPVTASGPHGNPQAVFLGTPKRAGSVADVFADMREEAWAGGADDLCWCEYGVAEVGDINDESRWYMANPSLGIVTTLAAIRMAARQFRTKVLAFAQEYLGYWLPNVANALLSPGEWEQCLVPAAPQCQGLVAYGVKFSADGDSVALCCAFRPIVQAGAPADAARVHVECIEVAPMSRGTAWLADWLAARYDRGCCVAIDGRAGAAALVEKLRQRRAPLGFVVEARAGDAVSAASMMLDSIRAGNVTRIESPALDVSALTSTKRKIGTGGGWGWGGEESAPIEAASLALWAVMTTKRDPSEEQEAWW